MWVFRIKGKKEKVQIPEKWSEITLDHYADFIEATSKLQNKLQQEEKQDSNLFDIVQNYRTEFNAMFSAFTGIDAKLVDKIKADNIATIYMHIRGFLDPPEAKNIDSFIFQGIEYMLPTKKTDYFGNVLHFGNSTFGEVVEAMQREKAEEEAKAEAATEVEEQLQEMSQQFIDNNYLALPYQIAILCRPKGEEYDDKKTASRAKLFKKLPMSIVWNIAFFLIRHKNKSMSLLNLFLKQKQKADLI